MEMADAPAPPAGYTVDDLDWLRDELGIAHLELDPWGSLVVAPATDEHELAVAVLAAQAVHQLALPPGSVRANGFAWVVPGGSGYLCIPDLAVLAPGWHRVDALHADPPPLLVVEVASPSTRAADRGRKLADYRLGRAAVYLLVDLPEPRAPAGATFEAHDFGRGRRTVAKGAIDLVVGGKPLHLDLG